MIYEIFEAHLEKLTARLNRLNAKLARISAVPASFKVLSYKDVPRLNAPNVLDRVAVVEVETTSPVANGWQFVARIVHSPEGNIINHVPGTVDVPVGYREGKLCCDHCRTNRFRRDTYVVTREGVTQQVGSTCLEEFLSVKTPQMLCAAMEFIVDIHNACEAASKLDLPLDRAVTRIPLDRYLQYVAHLTLTEGKYVTRSEAVKTGNRDLATSRRAYRMLFEVQPDINPPQSLLVVIPALTLAEDARNFVINKFSPKNDDLSDPKVDIRALVLSHFSAQDGLTDFEHNLYTIAKNDFIEPRLCGIAAYIIEYYRRAQQAQSRPEVPQLNAAGMPRIFGMFTNAAAHLKHPAIRLADEAGTHLHLSLAGEKSKNAGCIYVKASSGFAAPYYGKITADGKWLGVRECPAAVEPLLLAFAADPEIIAQKYGRLTGACCFCGRKLTDARSTDAGFGPVCAAKFGLNWGSHIYARETVTVAA